MLSGDLISHKAQPREYDARDAAGFIAEARQACQQDP